MSDAPSRPGAGASADGAGPKTGRVHLSGRLICADQQQLHIVKTWLPEHIRLSLAEPGCLGFSVTQSPQDPMVWLVEESFVDRAAFQAHQDRNRASAWFQASKDIRRDFQMREG